MSDTLPDLPDDVRDIIEPHLDLDPTVLATIGTEIAGKREEAKTARTSSGIETTWLECEEAYDGIDDANRGEVRSGRWSKGLSPDSPVTTGRTRQNTGHKSTVYLRLTTRYVDAGVAKLCEILLPADDKAFSFSEMPVPELIDAKEDESQVLHSDMGNAPLTRPLNPGETPPPGGSGAQGQASPLGTTAVTANSTAMPMASPAPTPVGATPDLATGATDGAPAGAHPPRVPLTVKDLAIEKIEMARKKAKAAETRIADWMVETQFRAEIRKVIADSARLGVGVLKGPIPTSKRVMVLKESPDGGVDLEIKEKIVPASVWVDPWNIYPDPACGENIHEGDYVFERDSMSAKKVRELKKLPGYIGSQIDQVLKEGPNKINTKTEGRPNDEKAAERNRFDVWYLLRHVDKGRNAGD